LTAAVQGTAKSRAKRTEKEIILKKFYGFTITFFLGCLFLCTAFAGNFSVPPGYTFFRGVAWNSTVYDAAIKTAKDKGVSAICLTNLSAVANKPLFAIKDNYQISEVKGDLSMAEGDIIAAACKEVSFKGITLSEGEYAIGQKGQLKKSSAKLPIKK
jgi:hypothetical protein